MGTIKEIAKVVRESSPIPEGITFNQVVKHPVVYLLLLACTACGYFVKQFTDSKKDQNKDCKEEIVYWKEAFTTERNINLQITSIAIENKHNFDLYKDSTQRNEARAKQTLIKKSKILLKPLKNEQAN